MGGKRTIANRNQIYEELATTEQPQADVVLSIKRELHTREADLRKQHVVFAKAMASGECNQTQAAKKAGYSPRSAYLQGFRLMRNDKIVALIRRYEELDALLHGFPKHVKRYEAKKILENEKTRDADKLSALNYLSRLDGDFIEGAATGSEINVTLNLGPPAQTGGQTVERQYSHTRPIHELPAN
ncbi:terminase small subunit [Teredinibacter franksiae]|uniref:terminase small subunit n=1 Tax=Teredinibacter franksiae TaxID=2761453 RepID=UPI0024837E62|nr:terminase small subunit [Teredinibacter franksiae]